MTTLIPQTPEQNMAGEHEPKPVQLEHSPASIIDCQGLRVVYRGGTIGLNNVSLTVRSDEFLVILGPSGAGKSTLLRSINRLVAPTAGTLRVFGIDAIHASGQKLRNLRRDVGMIFQQFNLVGRLTVLENVMSGRLAHTGTLEGIFAHARVFSPTHRAVAMDCLAQVGIAEKAHQRADQLSGGQQQRVAIARLLAQAPKVILADEPIASLDPGSASKVMKSLKDIHTQQNIPIVANLHQPEIAKQMASRIIGMRAGEIIFDGTPDELTSDVTARLYRGAAHDQETPSHTHKA